MISDALFSSDSGEWGTPDDLIAQLGPFDLDVCATPGRQKAPLYFAPNLSEVGWYNVKRADGTKERVLDQAFLEQAQRAATEAPPVAWDALRADLSWPEVARTYRVGRAWMNPPFGRGIDQWMRRASELGAGASGVTLIALVPARTDTAWWHDFVEPVRLGKRPGEIHFMRGRLSFAPGPGPKPKSQTSAPFPTALVCFEGKS